MLSRHTVQGCRKGWLSPGCACQEQMIGVLKVHWIRGLRRLIAAWCIAFCAPAVAQERGQVFDFDITHATLGAALEELARQSNLSLLFPNGLAGEKGVSPVKGRYSVDEALKIMLRETQFSGGLIGGEVISVSLSPENKAIDREGTVSSGKIKRGLLASVSAMLFGVGANGSVLAQNDAGGVNAAETEARDVIVVTSTRRDENLQDVPMAVSVLQPVALKSIGFVNIRDVVAFVPGVNESTGFSGGPSGTGRLNARGVQSQSGLPPVVSFYVDDVPVSGSTPNGSFFYPDAMLLDIEKIEFLKGPQGTLYGSTSLGGSVKYVTREPTLSDVRANAVVNLSTTKSGGFNQQYNARLSFPLVENRLGLTLSGFYEENDGVVDLVDVGTSAVFLKDSDAQDNHGYAADLLYQATDDLSFRFNYIHRISEWSDDGLVHIDAATGAPLFGALTASGNPLAAPNDFRLEFDLYSGTVNYDFGWANLTSVSAHTKSSQSLNNDQIEFAAFIDSITGNPPGTTTGIPTSEDATYKKFVQEVRLTSANSDKFEWMLGFFYTDEESPLLTSVLAVPSNLNLGIIDNVDTYEEYAVFGNANYFFTPDLDLAFGARVSWQDVAKRSFTDGLFFGFVPTALSNETSVTVDTYSVALRYRPRDDMSLYARAASGFRPAQTNLPFIDPASMVNLAPSTVKSDSLWSYELGVKGQLADGMINYDVALYYIDWSDFQAIFRLVAGGINGNAAEGVTSKGVEGTFSVEPFEGLKINSTVAFTDSDLNGDEPDIFGLEGQQVPDTPRWSSALSARYEFPVSVDITGHLGGGFRYSSARRTSFDDGNPLNPNPNFNIDEFIVADLNAGLSNGRFSVDIYATNLFNEVAYSSGFTTAASGLTTLVPVRPRTVGVVLSVDM